MYGTPARRRDRRRRARSRPRRLYAQTKLDADELVAADIARGAFSYTIVRPAARHRPEHAQPVDARAHRRGRARALRFIGRARRDRQLRARGRTSSMRCCCARTRAEAHGRTYNVSRERHRSRRMIDAIADRRSAARRRGAHSGRSRARSAARARAASPAFSADARRESMRSRSRVEYRSDAHRARARLPTLASPSRTRCASSRATQDGCVGDIAARRCKPRVCFVVSSPADGRTRSSPVTCGR